MCEFPAMSVVLSKPNDRSSVRSAFPVILLISLFKNELRAEFIVKALVFPSARYMPVVSMDTASFPLCSLLIACSSPCRAMSSGESRVNSNPISLSVLVMMTPQSKSMLLPIPPAFATVAFVLSIALMFKVGFIGSPVNSI